MEEQGSCWRESGAVASFSTSASANVLEHVDLVIKPQSVLTSKKSRQPFRCSS